MLYYVPALYINQVRYIYIYILTYIPNIYKAGTVTLNPIMLLEPEMTSNLEILRGKRF